MQRSLAQLQRMWVHVLDCGPVANNPVPVADNVVPMYPFVAINVVPNGALIAVPDDSYCGPLHIVVSHHLLSHLGGILYESVVPGF
jgi:hypothetical protein